MASPNTIHMIRFRRIVRYIQVASWLHLSGMLGAGIGIGFALQTLSAWEDRLWQHVILYAGIALQGWGVVLFSQMDAFSRFQNYKQVKDLLFEKGVKKRIVSLFSMSRCQRDAVKIAARDLGLTREVNLFFHGLGYRWFHILPDAVAACPSILFSPKFWKRTLFVKPYQSKYFLW